MVARLLVGRRPGPPRRPPIVDCGHARDLDVAIELPGDELEAVASGAQFVRRPRPRSPDTCSTHRTTLVFVNTRKMAERVAHQLAERLGAEEGAAAATGGDVDAALQVAAHHGSLSAARRRIVEQRLRAGDLRALVATASLELGIDVGPVELVCQIGSPRAIATFLQRVGRANHHVEGTPSGRLYPLTRDELVECTALLAGGAGRPPRRARAAGRPARRPGPAARGRGGRRRGVGRRRPLRPGRAGPPPSPTSTREDVRRGGGPGLLGHPDRAGAAGAPTSTTTPSTAGCGPGRGARLAALTSGGAIPETGDYRVVLDPDGVTVGSVHEDFAVEATAGDIFLLGTHSWRVVKVETGTVRVVDAADLPPTIPFWLGEAPARTAELSAEVGDLRAELEPLAGRGRRQPGPGPRCAPGPACPRRWPTRWSAYLGAGLAALGALPTRERLVVERFFDDAEGDPAHRPLPLRRPHQPGPRAWPCASGSASPSTSSSRPRPTTTPSCSPSGPSTASP